jgi:hypothetical protein
LTSKPDAKDDKTDSYIAQRRMLLGIAKALEELRRSVLTYVKWLEKEHSESVTES